MKTAVLVVLIGCYLVGFFGVCMVVYALVRWLVEQVNRLLS